jgi:hypothetical protein
MDGIEGVKLLQQVCVGFYQRVVPWRVALNDLLAALNDQDATQDPWGVVVAWRKFVAGDTGPNTRAGWPVPLEDVVTVHTRTETDALQRVRTRTAEELARRNGQVTSRELAAAINLSQESARVILAQMVAEGRLQKHGTRKDAWYGLVGQAGRDGTAGRNATEVYVADK